MNIISHVHSNSNGQDLSNKKKTSALFQFREGYNEFSKSAYFWKVAAILFAPTVIISAQGSFFEEITNKARN
jgi:hypothetical protein